MEKPRVILRRCEKYNQRDISSLIKESVKDLRCAIKGKVFIKPNVVSAHKTRIRHAYTHPVVVEAMIRVLREFSPDSISIGESGGYGSSTRMHFKASGYVEMARRTGADLFDFDERAREKVRLKNGLWHKEMMLPTAIKEADFKIWMPKLKYHAFAGITHSLKLNIGILSRAERLLYHDYRIHDKIVDLLEPGFPDLVVSDAIDITYGIESAPHQVRLGALIFSNHPLAADVAAAFIMGYQPEDIKYLKRASERGYGSLSLDDISVSGDADIEVLRAKPKGFPRLFQVLNELNTPIDFYTGPAPGAGKVCDGGCECAVKGCLGMVENRHPGALAQAQNGGVVCGVFKGDVVTPNGPVLLVGNCTKVGGRLEAREIHRIKGCPVDTRQLNNKLPGIFHLPSLKPDLSTRMCFLYNAIEKYLRIMMNRLFLNR